VQERHSHEGIEMPISSMARFSGTVEPEEEATTASNRRDSEAYLKGFEAASGVLEWFHEMNHT